MQRGDNTYKNLFVELINLISGGSLKITGSNEERSDYDTGSYLNVAGRKTNTDSINPPRWTSMDIRISFASFLQSRHQIEYEVYLIQSPELFKAEVSYRIPEFQIRAFMRQQDNGFYELQLWYQIQNKFEVTKKVLMAQSNNSSVTLIQQETKKTQTIYLNTLAKIAVLCRFKASEETTFPLTLNNTHGYYYTEIPVKLHNKKGNVIGGSFQAKIVTKQAFLNAYPLQNINL